LLAAAEYFVGCAANISRNRQASVSAADWVSSTHGVAFTAAA